MKENSSKTNKGYSFVETVIVIGIIIILAAMAVATVSIINSARTKDAAVSFGEEISTLKLKCMNMVPSDPAYDTYAISISKSADGKFSCELVEYDKSSHAVNPVSGEKINFTASAKVGFTGHAYQLGQGDKNGNVDFNDGAIIVCFNKNGSCISGYSDDIDLGEGFAFYKGDSDNPIARVYISRNGSVVIK